MTNVVSSKVKIYAELIWDYHQLRQPVVTSDAIIALGCHDIGVADHTASLLHQGIASVAVVTGANSPTTADLMPQGEAFCFKQRLLDHSIADDCIYVEPRARNTGENLRFSKNILGDSVSSVLVACMPYMERRAQATFGAQWPDIRSTPTSQEISFTEYLQISRDRDGLSATSIIEMMVGDIDRIMSYPDRGFSLPQPIPHQVLNASIQLVKSGYDRCLLEPPTSTLMNLVA